MFITPYFVCCLCMFHFKISIHCMFVSFVMCIFIYLMRAIKILTKKQHDVIIINCGSALDRLNHKNTNTFFI